MVKKKTLSRGDQAKEERKRVRKTLGKLKSLTVQPKTRERYAGSLESFFNYLAREGLTLPKQRDTMDGLVSDYIEFLWSEGEGRAEASNVLAALQDADPKLKGCLPGCWRLLRTWNANEVPQRAPPLSESVLTAMVGWAVMHEHYEFGLSLLVAFHGLLRTGELLGIQAWQVNITGSFSPAVISLGLTKSGKRHGAAESITLTEKSVLRWLWTWKRSAQPHDFLTSKPHVWRAMFSECVTSLKLDSWHFRPYSLRRGGATYLFTKCGSLDRVLLAGRWTAIKTAKIYLNSGLAMLSDIQIPRKLLHPFHHIFSMWQSSLPSLEHSSSSRRAGGRGKNQTKLKVRKKLGGGAVHFCAVISHFLIFGDLKCRGLGGHLGMAGSSRGTRGVFFLPGNGRKKNTAPRKWFRYH